MPTPEPKIEIERVLQLPENRVRWATEIKRCEEQSLSFNERAKHMATVIREMEKEYEQTTTR